MSIAHFVVGAGALLLASMPSPAAEGVPRPEYPQPQFERAQWLNLNGQWEFEFDDADQGLDEGWAAGVHAFSRGIVVPFAFESRRSGIGDRGSHPTLWYRRTFTVPEGWKDRRVLLNFGAVDYRASVWLNGAYLGGHSGGSVPFRFDITDRLKAGANQLVVRTWDPPHDRYLPRGKQYWGEPPRGIFFTRTSGIWQTVWLEAAGASYLERVRVTPSIDGTVRFDGRVAHAGANTVFEAIVSRGNAEVTRVTVPVRGDRLTATAFVRDPQLWAPAHPNLYDIRFELRDGARVVDSVKSYCGFREVHSNGGQIYLNGGNLYLKMVLDQGYWPETLLTPPSDEAIQYDIRMTLEFGFNGARKHQKVEDPRYLYWADRMGLLVSGEAPNAYLYDEGYAADFTREWIEILERDYSHPSIVIWAPINESWGVPDLTHDPAQVAHLKALYALTKSLDRTRLAIDNEGWEHTDATDLFAMHDYVKPGEAFFERYKDLGKGPFRNPEGLRAALIPGYAYNGSPFYLSELGDFGFLPPGAPTPPWFTRKMDSTPDRVLENTRSVYQAVARIPAIRGICFTELTDIEQEIAGLMTYDRKPKVNPQLIKELNDLLR